MTKARDLMYGTNVVVVSNQTANSKKILLFADWLFATTTFVPYIKSRALLMSTRQCFNDLSECPLPRAEMACFEPGRMS